MKHNKVIAIDGSIATGKTTISKLLAKNLDGIFLPTGKLYRLLTLFIIKNDIQHFNLTKIEQFINFSDIDFKEEKFYITGFEYDQRELFSETEMRTLPSIAKLPEIRLLANQVFLNIIDRNPNKYIILEGRDAGTVIYPSAMLKIFLTVSLEEATKRRFEQLKIINPNLNKNNWNEIFLSIQNRNSLDYSKDNIAFKKAIDSIEIDTTFLSEEEVVSKILEKVEIKK